MNRSDVRLNSRRPHWRLYFRQTGKNCGKILLGSALAKGRPLRARSQRGAFTGISTSSLNANGKLLLLLRSCVSSGVAFLMAMARFKFLNAPFSSRRKTTIPDLVKFSFHDFPRASFESLQGRGVKYVVLLEDVIPERWDYVAA